jgi:RNA polymerase sigma-70 factor, ECF subfamily
MRPSVHPPEDPAHEVPDAELVAQALRGERDAMEQLVRRHYRSAYITALAVLGSSTDAEDACHDALVRAAARLEECRDPSRVGGWLRAIARNRAKNLLAKRMVREGPALDTAAVPVESSVHQSLERAELRSRLEAALRQLTPAQREVVLRHDLEDWPHGAIAESLGTSVGMSRQHLFQARRRLREILGLATLEEYRDG